MRFSRLALALMLVASAAWVALPLVRLIGPDGVGGPALPAASSAGEIVRRGAAIPPKHVIPDGSGPMPTAAFRPEASAGPLSSAQAAEPSFEHGKGLAPLTPTVPLPPSPTALSASPPPLDFTYRSTVNTPPPPLLDANAPPPLSVDWPPAVGRGSAGRAAGDVGISMAGTAASSPASRPETYTIRDGDDLTGIALRFYGNPAAAEAIWQSNRDRLADPAMLPIGFMLRLPAVSVVGLSGGRGPRLIEPQ